MDTPSIQSIASFEDVIGLLEAHPDWRADLLRVLLTDDFLDLPRHVSRLTEQVTQLTLNVQALVEAQRRTETQLTTLTEIVQRQSVDVGRLKGDSLEVRYFLKGVPFMTRLVRYPHALSQTERDNLLEEAETKGLLATEESDEITLADLIVQGRRRGSGTTVYVVTEVSWGVGVDDVYRAAKRAALLAKAGVLAIPAVAGEWVTPDAQQLAPGLGVWQFMSSQAIPPAEM
jgi:hypothetical protein